MKRSTSILACAVALAMPGWAGAQGNRPAVPEMPAQAPSSSNPSVVPGDTAGSGMVRVPPATDSRAVTKPPENVDPAMDDATRRIDRQNREKGSAAQAPADKGNGKSKPGEKPVGEYK